MLARYKIYRGSRPAGDPQPRGIRQDIRKHVTGHCLHPPKELVETYLADPTDRAWNVFNKEYEKILDQRYRAAPEPFQKLAALALEHDVYLGCNCPTRVNPDVNRCHTVLALRYMKKKFRRLEVKLP